MTHDARHPDPSENPALDARLTHILRDGIATPSGLTDRVFEASRSHLPIPAPLAQLNCAADEELESRLTEILAAQPVPAGLADRVHAASVCHLPSRLQIRLAGHQHQVRQPRRVFGGRLAMAASVGLVACVGVWFAKMPGSLPPSPVHGPSIAQNQPPAATSNGLSDARLASLSMPTDGDWRLIENVDHGHQEVQYLVETDGLSLQALSAELDAILDRSDDRPGM